MVCLFVYDISVFFLSVMSDPNDILAVIYLQQGKLTEARELMQAKLLKRFHELSLSCSGLAESYLNVNNADLVDKYYRLAISVKQLLSPEGDGVLALANEYYSLGEALVKLNKNREALQVFQKMIALLQQNDLNRFGQVRDIWCFSELKLNENPQPLHISYYEIFNTLFQQPIYDSLRDDEEFEKILSELKDLTERLC
ncbi:tetratricopeptide repeat protein [Dethiobacter alkaliphilus]|uniref:tetratricopeptide repeat protein n=1 Tax=Dethiobacter alkaliphilus TaxID=427926 RepID=UPI0022262B7E|nr:hypothetical protein [Dethiobacter alkaliphilus]MCW3490379.1 hypothetical protein [Dethiobacter alkaliphilus]